jgi:branched-chain amino acid transport system substrate-binding protein
MKSSRRLFKFCSLVISLALIGGCAFTRKKPAEKAPAQIHAQFNKIQIDLAAGSEKKAIQQLNQIVQHHPQTDVAHDALLLLGRIHFKARDYQLAYDKFMAIVNSEVFSPGEGDALLGAAQSLHRLGRLDEALALTQKSLRIPGLSDELRLEIQKARFAVLIDLGDRLEALRSAVFIATKDPNQASRETFHVKALDIVESRLTESELVSTANSSDMGFVRGQALFRVGLQAFEQRDFARAKDNLSQAIDILQSGQLVERAQALLKQIDSRRQVDTRTIGAVLPLTGKYANVAQKTLRGLQLGLGIYGGDRSNIRLAVIDSEGNPDGARRAVERLVSEDHVIAIVGSLLSKTASAVAAKADELGVPSIALSQKAGLTDIGTTVFRDALTSEMQVRHLVQMSMEQLGHKKFAILYPNDAYGIEFANLFWDEVLAHGGSITGAQVYSPTDTDFSGPVRRLVGKYYIEDRTTEYRIRLTDWFKKQKSVGARQRPPDELLPPLVEFDAVFIPDGVKALSQIAPTLSYYDVENVTLLGTNLWNAEELMGRADKHVEGAIFADSFLPGDASLSRTRFYKEFQRVFGEIPEAFEVQAYDAGLILRQSLAGGAKSRVDLIDQLNRLKDFPGAIGRLNYSSPREIARPIVALTVKDGRIVRLEDKPLPPKSLRK